MVVVTVVASSRIIHLTFGQRIGNLHRHIFPDGLPWIYVQVVQSSGYMNETIFLRRNCIDETDQIRSDQDSAQTLDLRKEKFLRPWPSRCLITPPLRPSDIRNPRHGNIIKLHVLSLSISKPFPLQVFSLMFQVGFLWRLLNKQKRECLFWTFGFKNTCHSQQLDFFQYIFLCVDGFSSYLTKLELHITFSSVQLVQQSQVYQHRLSYRAYLGSEVSVSYVFPFKFDIVAQYFKGDMFSCSGVSQGYTFQLFGSHFEVISFHFWNHLSPL